MKTFADKIISFNKEIHYTGSLPPGIKIMNPFRENEQALAISSAFYRKYYNDNNKRQLILGINPGRFGAGLTGIPFTDPKRLESECGIIYNGNKTHEPSSDFIYQMINAYGGPAAFYGRFYIHSICPLGFTAAGKNGKEINYNYYDSRELLEAVKDFIIDNIHKQLSFGVDREICFCLGTGKNEKFLRAINEQYGFFKKIIALEHPRFVMQYKAKRKEEYVEKYLRAFGKLM